MKGCFRFIFATDKDHDGTYWDYEYYEDCKRYIHVTQIREVREYIVPDFICENLCGDVQGSVMLHYTYRKQYPDEFACKCGWFEEYKQKKKKSVRMDEMDTHCQCKYEALKTHPIYVIIDEKDKRYYIHPCEQEHMQRYLAGTDDPMHDLVHELRYNHTIGIETRTAEINSNYKKRKIDNE